MKTILVADKTFVRLLAQDNQRKKLSVVAFFFVLSALGMLFGWYLIASDYRYQAVAGIYKMKSKDTNSTLVLRGDQTFQQTLDEHGIHKSSQGTWSRVGEGGIAFSKGFLPVPGQEPAANGEVYAAVEKTFGLFTTIHVHHNVNEPVYQKLFLSNAEIE